MTDSRGKVVDHPLLGKCWKRETNYGTGYTQIPDIESSYHAELREFTVANFRKMCDEMTPAPITYISHQLRNNLKYRVPGKLIRLLQFHGGLM